ncbi:MAG: ABC transporter substrate-binding protein [Deinococcota bacterium]|nr:ABC transporter substrate-binding protein [Deinococcota bacterium]
MTTDGPYPLARRLLGALAAVAITVATTVAAVALAGATWAQEEPRRGGVLEYIVSAEPPSFDAHRETTFAMLHPIRPHYNLLIKFDLENFPEVVGDLAESWEVADDGLTYTFTIREGVRFHDGSLLSARDVKATYDKIIFPAEGVASVRQATYAMVESIEAQGDSTVVFALEWPSEAFLANLASPFNWVYQADRLEEDPHWYERNVMGTGPYTFVEYVGGSHWEGRRNEDYFKEGLPYLDSYRALFIRDPSAQVAAVRGGRAHLELRGFTPSQRDELVQALGDEIEVQESAWLCNNTVVINTQRPPFDDARVRRALTLAIDRWAGAQALSQIAIVGPVGGVMRPGSAFAPSEEELEAIAGFGRDIEAAREEARRLLDEAGVAQGFSFTLLNRDVRMPYEPIGIYVIDQWRRIGLNAEHLVRETGPYLAELRGGDYDVAIDFTCDFIDEPDVQLNKFISAELSPANYGQYDDERLDALYEQQSRERDPEERMRLVREFERIVLDEEAYQFHVLWWYRIIPYRSSLEGYHISPAHHLEPDIETYWLSE